MVMNINNGILVSLRNSGYASLPQKKLNITIKHTTLEMKPLYHRAWMIVILQLLIKQLDKTGT